MMPIMQKVMNMTTAITPVRKKEKGEIVIDQERVEQNKTTKQRGPEIKTAKMPLVFNYYKTSFFRLAKEKASLNHKRFC
jgi:hypothetical protein